MTSRTAVPSGEWHQFTDLDRWYTRDSHPGLTVQYCADHRDVAFARARRMADQSGFPVSGLRTGPGLLDVEIDQTSAADLTTPLALTAAGIPDYPHNASTPAVRAACAAAGTALVTAREWLIAVPATETQVATMRETLAVLPRVTLSVRRRRRWPW